MDRIDSAFFVLSQKMRHLPVPDRTMPAPQTLASLIDKVNAAKRQYQPRVPR